MKRDKYFEITSVHRDDLEQQGFDTSNVDDATMEQLAEKMGEAYVNDSFWADLEAIANDVLNIPKRRDNDMCDHCGSTQDTWRNSSGELQCDNCGETETQ